MKTYLRLLNFARPFGLDVPLYFLYTVLQVLFGVINFTLLIPLFQVLFQTADQQAALIPTEIPSFSFSISYFENLFYYYFHQLMLTKGKMYVLYYVCGVILVSNLLKNLFRYLCQRILTKLRARIISRVRTDLFQSVSKLDVGFFNNSRKGDLISRFSNDVQEVENSVIGSLSIVFKEPITFISFFVTMFVLSPQMTLFALLTVPIFGTLIAMITKSLKRSSISGQDVLGKMLGTVDEFLMGIKVLRASNAEPYIQKRFQDTNEGYKRFFVKYLNKRESASPLSEWMGVMLMCVVLLFGGSLVLQNDPSLSAEKFLTYLVLVSQVLTPAKSFMNTLSGIQRGIVAGERVFELIDTQAKVVDAAKSIDLQSFNDKIELKNVSFSYEAGTEVLKGINMSIPKGKKIALVGPSGGGKSTIADLLPRFFDPDSGQILLDGQDIKQCNSVSLRKLMGIVSQDTFLFNDSIYTNICFGTANANKEHVREAARVANALGFIEQSEQGFDTIVGDRGVKLSGGQRQRLSIARAVYKNAPILIMDEATSALDNESEKLVQEALFNLMENKTALIIAHRLSTIQHCDWIYVIDKGEIVEQGTHLSLLEMEDGLYKKLVKLNEFQK